MAPSVVLAMASRAENLLMADIAIRLHCPASRRVLFCEVPFNAARRRRAIRALIGSMAWDAVQVTPTIKYSSLPAGLRRLGGGLLERGIQGLALFCSLLRVVVHGLRHRGTSVDLVCGRPRLALLVLCHLLHPKRIILLDTGPKIDAFTHLRTAYAQLRALLSPLGLAGRLPGTVAGCLASLSDRPIPLLCWSMERYQRPEALLEQVRPTAVEELVAERAGAPPYGSRQGPPFVFLIGKPTATPAEDLAAMIALWRASCPSATPVYFLHPREQPDAAVAIMGGHGIAIADRSLCVESHVMTTFKDVALQQVISIRDSRSLQTLRLLYGDHFDVRLIR
ncbi:MAG: hypothetical protein RLZZ124_588 [Cyanobacteriota bacterium]|jgi:hypothetical protein